MLNKNYLKNLDCPHFGPCAGCVFDQRLDSFPLIDEAKEYFKEKGITDTPVHFFGSKHWRTRAKLAVRGSFQNPQIGLFKKASHEVLSIPDCQVHHPIINKAVSTVREWIIHHSISPYDEKLGTGLLRYLQCTVERHTGKVQLVLVFHEKIAAPLLKSLSEAFDSWHSIWINLNQRNDNVIFGSSWECIFGEEWLWEKIGGIECCFHPGGFMQGNLSAYEALLERIQEWVSPSKTVVEYYAGTGVIGLSLAAKGCSVQCFEINSACEIPFKMAKERLNSSQIEWFCLPTSSALDHLTEGEVIIVDPPRKGLDPQTSKALASVVGQKELIYVSCGWNSCKKDIDLLTEQGWKVINSEIYLFFPGSNHIETLVRLQKI